MKVVLSELTASVAVILLSAVRLSGAANQSQPAVPTPDDPTTIVATIGEYVITRGRLEAKLMEELRPNPDNYGTSGRPANAQTVILKMLADKAMIMEGRSQGLAEHQEIRPLIERLRKSRIANLVLISEMQSKVEITAQEIQQQLAANPNLTPSTARESIQRAKARAVLDRFYADLLKKYNVKKAPENFPKAAEIHQRLLTQPKSQRSGTWIIYDQIQNELTEDEKNTPLATFDGGKVTLKDLLEDLNEMSPPSRPRNLSTPAGMEQFVDRVLRVPVLVAEANSRGLDKDPQLLAQIRETEDYQVLYKVQGERLKDIKDPNDQQIKAYFEKNKEAFGTRATVRIDEIWCPDLKSAQAAKAELDKGADFNSVKQKSSMYKTSDPAFAQAGTEGQFWNDLRQTEPNRIVGPIKGFCADGIKWRIVKVLEKKPAQLREFSEEMKGQVVSQMRTEQTQSILAEYGKVVLKKYPYEIYADKIKDIDPFNIP